MGSCQDNRVVETNQRGRRSHRNKNSSSFADEPPMYSKQKEEFPDKEEWPGDRFTGIGIKRMRGYKCNLPIDKLILERNYFWKTRGESGHRLNKIWRVINQACVYDAYRANLLLEEYELQTAEGCLNHIIDKHGNHYHIPNYCINDPYFEKDFKLDNSIQEKSLVVNLYEPSQNLTIPITILNTATGEDLKKEFRKKSKIPLSEFGFRLFFGGNEIKNEQFIYQHKINDGFKVMVMKIPKGKGEHKKRNKGQKVDPMNNNTKDDESSN